MSATNCPFCQALVNFGERANDMDLPPWLGSANGEARRISAQQCNNGNCRMWVVAFMQGESILRMWPEHVGGKSFPDVPSHIGDAADEAYRCYSIRAYRASTLLARSVIEATAKQVGVVNGILLKKIKELYERGLIREFVRDGAHEVRYLGNDMAHGDFVDPIDQEDAELALSLMDEVLDEIFQAPARVNAARARRLAKSQARP